MAKREDLFSREIGRNTCYDWAQEIREWADEFLKQLDKPADRYDTHRARPDIKFPQISAFARKKNITTSRLMELGKRYVQLREAFEFVKDVQQELLVHYGLNGRFNPAAFIFTGKNFTGMKDKVEHENTGTIMIGWQGTKANAKGFQIGKGKFRERLGIDQEEPKQLTQGN